MKPPNNYQGHCFACRRESHYLERDHRIPTRLGGSYGAYNLQDLCLECHKRKTLLECSLMSFECESDVMREWFQLAFQDDLERIKAFVDNLSMRATHFREVFQQAREASAEGKSEP